MLTASINEQEELLPARKSAFSAIHAGLTCVLRAGRITRLLPRVRGFYKLRGFYQSHLPKGFLDFKNIN